MIKIKFLSIVLCLCMVLSMCAVSAFAEPTLNLGGFDYSNIRISLSADTSDPSVSEAVVYIFKSDGTPLNDGNPPVYMDFVTLTGGAFEDKEISFPLAFDYGNYTVAVYYEGASSPLVSGFAYYSPSELLQARKDEILLEAKAAVDADSLKAVFFDADSAGGIKLPTNETIIASSADFADYDSVENKLEVFNRMIVEEYKKLTSFDDFIALFEDCASEQKEAENRKPTVTPSSPGSDNTSTGGHKGSVSVSGPKGNGGSAGSGSSVGTVGGNASGVAPSAPAFNDMKGHWAEEYAKTLFEKKIINGYEDGLFKGENNLTRAELTKMLVTGFNIDAASSVSFNDVAPDSWYRDYVSKASGAGIVTGYNGNFNPNDNITRQDAALMVYRVLEKLGKLPEGTSSFNDDSNISDYALAAVKALGGAKILTGDTNGNFNPSAAITRAEIAAVLCRALEWAQSN